MAIKYDLIIPALSSTQKLIKMTQRTIESARQDNADMNVIVIESFPRLYNYENCKIIKYTGEFCYNKALNMGIDQAQGDIYILANNDLYFHKGWSVIGETMEQTGFESASAYSDLHRRMGFNRGDLIYPGYTVATLLCGWCIFSTRSCIEKIGRLDERFNFWHSDNIYGDQLQEKNIRHGLFCNVQVDHITSQTLRTLNFRKQRRYTYESVNEYKRLKNHAL